MTIDLAELEFLRRDMLGNLPMTADNAASRAVAEVAGFVPFLTLEHWTTDRSA